MICGGNWRVVAKELVQDALYILEAETQTTKRKCDTYQDSIHLPVVITVSTKRATITVSLDCLSELEEECELRMAGESKQRKRR
jgi:hypothetical protein